MTESEKKYITAKELAERWGTTTSYLANRRHDKKGLPYTKLLGRVMYDLEDIVMYESTRRLSPEDT